LNIEKMMTLESFIDAVNHHQTIAFSETMAIIDTTYHYTPSDFTNGLSAQKISNKAGTNEGSCKLFYFARLHHLTVVQTLSLFGEYYQQVLKTPEGTDHMNIRHFKVDGWSGIWFQQRVLTKK
jgi:heme oxygenase